MPTKPLPRKQRRHTQAPGLKVDPRLQALLAEKSSALEAAHLRLRMSDRLASMGALAAGLGHDMNNVLLPVRAHLEAASAGALVPAVRRHVDAVLESVAYLQQLADGLHFLALDSEGEASYHAVTDVATWWSHVGPLLTKAVPKHVKVEVSIQEDLPPVGISAHGLTQAALNLVVNAGEACLPPGRGPRNRRGRRSVVRMTATTGDSGDHVVVSVADNGRGMSETTKRRAFEMFYTARTRGLGTGLGLPMVARVVSQAGGSVHIESRSGKGTTVSMHLPIAPRADGESACPSAVIMVADGRDLAMLRHILEVTGIQVGSASDLDNADLWITEPTAENLRIAGPWRKLQPSSRLVLFGKPRPAATRAWKALRPLTISDRTDLEAIRSTLGKALA